MQIECEPQRQFRLQQHRNSSPSIISSSHHWFSLLTWTDQTTRVTKHLQLRLNAKPFDWITVPTAKLHLLGFFVAEPEERYPDAVVVLLLYGGTTTRSWQKGEYPINHFSSIKTTPRIPWPWMLNLMDYTRILSSALYTVYFVFHHAKNYYFYLLNHIFICVFTSMISPLVRSITLPTLQLITHRRHHWI